MTYFTPQFPELFQDQTVQIPEQQFENGIGSVEVLPALTFTTERSVGSGSFGVVFRARTSDGQNLAVKKVFYDRRYRNREIYIICYLHPHDFIVYLVNFYCSAAQSYQNGYYLNILMYYYPENGYQLYRAYYRVGRHVPLAETKLYTYYMLRGLAYMHCFNIANRDLKPQNTLVDRTAGRACLCDLGSAKQLNPQEPNIAYICSRYYRAPELIFGARNYDTKIDVWSFACVVAEIMIGRPLFPGQSPIDYLVEIIKVMGPPSLVELKQMNPQLREYNFPVIQTTPLQQTLGCQDEVVLDFFKGCLKYAPNERFSAFRALAHPFYDEVRQKASDPHLFAFNQLEKEIIQKELGEEGLKLLCKE